MVSVQKRRIYFEKQKEDRLCGLHCLNSLLQGPFFDVSQLSDIALELDKKESLLLNKQTHSNVDVDGNYNVQVLTEALKLHGVTIKTIRKDKLDVLITTNYDKIEAFIFNSSTHWFAIRRIQNVWYDLNSTNKAPLIISDFFLSAFILGTQDIGYTNFLVENLPPLPDEEYYLELQPYQYLFTIEELQKLKKNEDDQRKARDNKDKDKEVDKDIKEKEEDGKFKAFTGKGISLSDHKNHVNDFEDLDDPELKQAMEMSLNIFIQDLEKKLPVLDSNKEVFTINFRFNEISFMRGFNSDNTIQDLINFCKVKINTFKEIELFETWPRKIYNDYSLSLKLSGMSKNQTLMVKILQ